MTNEIASQQQETELNLRLVEFGLNPEHWNVFQLSESKAAATHFSEPLVLLGTIGEQKNQKVWHELEIYSHEELFSA